MKVEVNGTTIDTDQIYVKQKSGSEITVVEGHCPDDSYLSLTHLLWAGASHMDKVRKERKARAGII